LPAFAILKRSAQDKPKVNSLRICIVQYLNTAPLVRGFTHGPLQERYQLSFAVPSECAEALRSRNVDIAIIPAIEYQRIDDLVLLPNLAIASKKSVRSLLLLSKKPIQDVASIALDRSSRSTQVLTRILCQRMWNIKPKLFEAEPDLPAMLGRADAALLIGDPALKLSLGVEASAKSEAPGELSCPGRAAGLPRVSTLFVYDIVEKWRALTNLPAVLAVWAARSDAATPQVVRDFQQSLAFGLQRLEEISAEASREMEMPVEMLRRYLRENIDYTLDAENLAGLRRYYDLSAELGLIPEVKQIVMAGGLNTAQQIELATPRCR
jgi:chorismate dehydratase